MTAPTAEDTAAPELDTDQEVEVPVPDFTLPALDANDRPTLVVSVRYEESLNGMSDLYDDVDLCLHGAFTARLESGRVVKATSLIAHLSLVNYMPTA